MITRRVHAASDSTLRTTPAAVASHIGVKRHLDTKSHEPEDSEEESKSAVNRMEIDQEGRNHNQSQSVTQRQSKRLKTTTDEELEEGITCLICKEEFLEPSSQPVAREKVARVLPCMHQVCHACIVELIDRKKSKSTIDCPRCFRAQPLYQHPDGRADSESIASLYHTRQQFTAELKRSEGALLLERVQKVNACSEKGCEHLATHQCTECGPLCRQHERELHLEDTDGHVCSTFEQIEQKKQQKIEDRMKKRILDVDAALHELGCLQKSWNEDSDPHRQRQHMEKEIDGQFDTQFTRLAQLKQHIVQWEQELQQKRSQFNKSSGQLKQQLVAFQKMTTAKEEELTHAKRLSCAGSEVEFQRLINLNQIRLTVIELQLGAAQTQIAPIQYPSLESVQQLIDPPQMRPGLPLIKSVPNGLATLEKFLHRSDQSLANATLIYQASSLGWTKDDFDRHCLGKSHTLTLVKVAGHEYVFGAYIAPELTMQKGGVPDPSNKSFLFSLVNKARYPFRLSLTKGSSAIDLSFPSVCFGHQDMATKYFNFWLFNDKFANSSYGNSSAHLTSARVNTAFAYQLDEESRKSLPRGFKEHLTRLGDSQFFGASEIEVYQLINLAPLIR